MLQLSHETTKLTLTIILKEKENTFNNTFCYTSHTESVDPECE